MTPIFDSGLRALRRDRAKRVGPALFLAERVFDDLSERIALHDRRFDDALLLGCPDPAWPKRLEAVAGRVAVLDPGPGFAGAAGGAPCNEERLDLPPESFDLIVAIGTLDTVDDLPGALAALARALRPGGLLIGAMSGGETLPRLRSAMRAADQQAGGAQPHIHPRVEAAQLAPLLERAGLGGTVVDVDRVRVSYTRLDDLVRDLRAMAATNVLRARPRFIDRAAIAAARKEFATNPIEIFEVLHFASWKQSRTAPR